MPTLAKRTPADTVVTIRGVDLGARANRVMEGLTADGFEYIARAEYRNPDAVVIQGWWKEPERMALAPIVDDPR